jgi:MraZ protein
MFTGNYTLNLDSKGRMNIPAKYKEVLETKYNDVLFITTKSNCLTVYPQSVWDVLINQVRQLSSLKKEVSEFKRLFLGSAQEVTIKHGRILIPANLRSHAGIAKAAVLVGVDDTFEIWGKDSWIEFFQDRQESLDDLGDKLADLGDKLSNI